jgi:hypothetical protein
LAVVVAGSVGQAGVDLVESALAGLAATISGGVLVDARSIEA